MFSLSRIIMMLFAAAPMDDATLVKLAKQAFAMAETGKQRDQFCADGIFGELETDGKFFAVGGFAGQEFRGRIETPRGINTVKFLFSASRVAEFSLN